MCVSLKERIHNRYAPTSSTREKEVLRIKELMKSGRLCVILSYPTLRSELSKSNSLLFESWEVCVLDEGHYIRNSESQLAMAARSVQANHRLVLSGTPVQNCLDDVFGMFEFIAPYFLGDYDSFFEYYVRPICQSYRSHNRDVIVKGNERLEELNRTIAPFLLRRTKEEVRLEIPPKSINDLECPLSEEQILVYSIIE